MARPAPAALGTRSQTTSGHLAQNLQRYAQEYGFNAQNYDTLFDKGLDQGKAMMEEMKRSGVDGCRGVLGSFQNERVIGYEE